MESIDMESIDMESTNLEVKKSSSVDGYLFHPVMWPRQGKFRKARSEGMTYDPSVKAGTCLCGSAQEFCPDVDFSFLLPGGDIRITIEKVNKDSKAKGNGSFERAGCVAGGENAVQLAERGVGTTQPCQPTTSQTSKQTQSMSTQTTTTQLSPPIQTMQLHDYPTTSLSNTCEAKTVKYGKSAANSPWDAPADSQPVQDHDSRIFWPMQR